MKEKGLWPRHWFGDKKNDQQMAEEARKQADPTTYSFTGVAPEPVLLDEKSVEDAHTGEEFFSPNFLEERERHAFSSRRSEMQAAAEFVTAQLAKGILNISDIVYDSSRSIAHSHKAELAKIHPADEDSMRADMLILATVFGDGDHALMWTGEGDNLNFERGPDGIRYALYDFEESENLFMKDALPSREYLAKHPGVAAATLGKLRQLKEHWSGEEGLRFISALLRKTGLPLERIYLIPEAMSAQAAANPADALQRRLLERVAAVEEFLDH